MELQKILALMENELTIDIQQLKHLKFEKINGEHVVTLVDTTGYSIISGYGKNVLAAINDLHSGLL